MKKLLTSFCVATLLPNCGVSDKDSGADTAPEIHDCWETLPPELEAGIEEAYKLNQPNREKASQPNSIDWR